MPAAAQRALFPRGLAQPAGGFRFGADTLLLAAFASAHLKPHKGLTGLDLGTGCGAAAIGLLLLRPELDLRLTGIDTGPESLACAGQNVLNLDLAPHYQPLLADVQDHHAPGCGYHFALSNPPFRRPGTGRTCPEAARHRARFEGPGGFAAFAACAARNLRPGGQLFLVHLAERLPELLCTLQDAGLHPRRLVPVQGQVEKPPRLVLIQAMRGGGTGLDFHCPLVLYGPDGALTAEAAAFCPFFSVNPLRHAPNSPA